VDPAWPLFGETCEMVGAGGQSVKLLPLVTDKLPTVTWIGATIAVENAGKVTTSCVLLAELIVPLLPPSDTALNAATGLKFAPVMVMALPPGACVGLKPVRVGAGTVKDPLLVPLREDPYIDTEIGPLWA